MKRILLGLLFLSFLYPQSTVGGWMEINSTGHVTYPHSAGLMWISTGGTISITEGGTFQKMIGGAIDYSNAHLENFNESTNGRLTYIGTITRDFNVRSYNSIESGETAQEVMIRIAKGGSTIEGTEVVQDYTAINKHSNTPTGWIVELATNEYLEMFITSNTTGDNIIIHNSIMVVSEY